MIELNKWYNVDEKIRIYDFPEVKRMYTFENVTRIKVTGRGNHYLEFGACNEFVGVNKAIVKVADKCVILLNVKEWTF